MIWESQNFKFHHNRGCGYPKWPPFGQNFFFFCPKKISCIFSESSFQNLMFDTKTNLLSFVDAKIWSFKNWRCAKNAKIWNAHNTPLGVLEQKNFGFPSFSIGGTFTPKMIKIGEIRVLSYLDLSWNEPKVENVLIL